MAVNRARHVELFDKLDGCNRLSNGPGRGGGMPPPSSRWRHRWLGASSTGGAAAPTNLFHPHKTPTNAHTNTRTHEHTHTHTHTKSGGVLFACRKVDRVRPGIRTSSLPIDFFITQSDSLLTQSDMPMAGERVRLRFGSSAWRCCTRPLSAR